MLLRMPPTLLIMFIPSKLFPESLKKNFTTIKYIYTAKTINFWKIVPLNLINILIVQGKSIKGSKELKL